MKTSNDPDEEDFYWQEMLVSDDLFTPTKATLSFDKSPKFPNEYLLSILPETSKLKPFYNIGEAYGWPLNWTCKPFLSCQTVRNHPTAEKQFPCCMIFPPSTIQKTYSMFLFELG